MFYPILPTTIEAFIIKLLKIKNMREVLFKKWVPSSPGMSGHYESDYTHLGLFHQFGNAYEEFESGAGNYTVAIVELADGTVVEVLPTNLKFINK